MNTILIGNYYIPKNILENLKFTLHIHYSLLLYFITSLSFFSLIASTCQSLQHHNLRTEIVPMEIDVLKEWGKVVEASKECTVIFNMVDVGNYFDFAVQSLALLRKVPMVIGGVPLALSHLSILYNSVVRHISDYCYCRFFFGHWFSLLVMSL